MEDLILQIARYLEIPSDVIPTIEEKYLKINTKSGSGYAEDIMYEKETDLMGNVKVKCNQDLEVFDSFVLCKHCKNTKDFAEDNGEIICKNCGLVIVDHFINESYIGIVFDKDGSVLEDAPAVGDLPKKHLPAWFNNGIASKLKCDIKKKYNKSTSDEHKVKQILKFSKEIKQIACLFQLPDIVQAMAADYFSEMRRFRERIHATSFPFIIFACLKKSINNVMLSCNNTGTDTDTGTTTQITNCHTVSPKSFCTTMSECILRGGYVPECYLCGTRFESIQKQRLHQCPCIPPWIFCKHKEKTKSAEIEQERVQRMLRKRKLVTNYSELGTEIVSGTAGIGGTETGKGSCLACFL